MRTRRSVIFCIVVIAGVGALYARKNKEDWLDKTFNKWNEKQVRTVLQDSPWSRHKDYKGQVGKYSSTGQLSGAEHGEDGGAVGAGGGTLGVDVPTFTFTATFFTSLPVREAYVRMFQIENHYDSMSAAKQQAFNQSQVVNSLLHGDVSQEVIVNLTYHTNDPNAVRDMNQWFNTQTADTLNQNAYLYTPAGQISLEKYEPPSATHGMGARFIFPRQFKGEPILSSASGRLRFQLSWAPGANQTVYIDFKPEEMMYQGQLSY